MIAMRKAPPTRNLCPRPRFYFNGDRNGDGDDFGAGNGDEDGKAFPDLTLPCCHPYIHGIIKPNTLRPSMETPQRARWVSHDYWTVKCRVKGKVSGPHHDM